MSYSKPFKYLTSLKPKITVGLLIIMLCVLIFSWPMHPYFQSLYEQKNHIKNQYNVLFKEPGKLIYKIYRHDSSSDKTGEQTSSFAKRILKEQFYAQKYLNPEINKALKSGRYFDIHYFVEDDHLKQPPKIINQAKARTKQDQNQVRELLQINRTEEQLENIFSQMAYKRLQNVKDNRKNPKYALPIEVETLIQFAYTLSQQSQNQDYIQAQYNHFDKNYQIGKFGKQLPLCLAMVGKNNAKVIIKMYDSIRRQNYSNYRIAQIDDNSDDNTIQIISEYLQKHPHLKERTTILMQPYQRNSVYNRFYINTEMCKDGDIIIDLDTDDYLIGNQVFQLVNTMYQKGHMYQGKHQQLWSLYFDYITAGQPCCPATTIYGKVDQSIIKQLIFRRQLVFRTTHLRTYLQKLFSKVDRNDFVDRINIKKGQFIAENPDALMMPAVLEMSAPKHIAYIDEFVYFYTGSSPKQDEDYPTYTVMVQRTTPTYLPLETLDSQVVRGPPAFTKDHIQSHQQMLKNKLLKFKQKVIKMYQKSVEQFK